MKNAWNKDVEKACFIFKANRKLMQKFLGIIIKVPTKQKLTVIYKNRIVKTIFRKNF